MDMASQYSCKVALRTLPVQRTSNVCIILWIEMDMASQYSCKVALHTLRAQRTSNLTTISL